MSDVLDQSEIDDLLSSLSQEGPLDDGLPDDDEADSGAALPENGGATTDAALYDFKRPERVSKDQMRALSSIHGVFARNLSATLSGLLRTIIDVRVIGVEQLTYSEFIHSLPNPTCFVILEAPPLEGQMCLELSPLIVFPIVDRLLGGSNNSLYIPQRPLTSIEWGLIQRIVDRALDHLSEVWRNLVEARFATAETETNPQLVHIVAPSEVVVFITFEIKLGQNAGTMSLCIPFNTIESVLSHLTSQSWFYRPKATSGVHATRLLRNLAKSKMSMTAFLGQTTIRLSQLRALRPGDVLQIDKRERQDFVLQLEGHNKYAGKAGQHRGFRALQLTRTAEADERL